MLFFGLLFTACDLENSKLDDPFEKTESTNDPNEPPPETDDPESSLSMQPKTEDQPELEPIEIVEGECNFGYAEAFGLTTSEQSRSIPPLPFLSENLPEDGMIYPEPPPPFLWQYLGASDSLTMPGYDDDMPLFERSLSWDGVRCYELPDDSSYLTESQAYELYISIIEKTTGETVDQSDRQRNVMGLRGAWPGTFSWHGNNPNYFNDTLVVLWMEDGTPKVREFPVNTDTGARYFGYHSSSSLRPNRQYSYTNGWHRGYNALQIDEWGYKVQDDTNGNGHWDSDRNGWLDGGYADHERTGSGHNIHLASVDGPLGQAQVDNWSAGCQTIPGIDNWTQFIDVVWSDLEDPADYYLVDVRDIDSRVWQDCTPDGSHECPYEINSFPFTDTRSTVGVESREFDVYNCSDADESGPEIMYVFTTSTGGNLEVSVQCDEPVDIDIHLLEGDDANACRARGHHDFTDEIGPGRYMIAVDTWASDGTEWSGDYLLRVDLN